MKQAISNEDLMCYLDDEMPADERKEFEEHLKLSTELQRKLAIYQALRTDLRNSNFYLANYQRSVWDQVRSKVTKRLGWILLIVGWIILTAYGVYFFLADPEESSWEKWGAGLLWAGVLALLISVIRERYKESKTDPYKDVLR
jgi:hypothetical protein